MKIVILGAGQVGSTVAAELAGEERNDVTVVDRNPTLLAQLAERLDIRTVVGHAAHPDVLTRAGGAECDMIIAVTDSDEVNMVACQVAFALWKTPTKIARIRALEYTATADLFSQANVPVDITISPEQLVTENIRLLMQYPGALQVLDFAGGRVRMVAVRAKLGGPLVGNPLKVIREHVPDVETRVAAVYRKGQPMIPHGGLDHRGGRRGLLHRRQARHPQRDLGAAQARTPGAQGVHRRRRPHRHPPGPGARGDLRRQADRARQEARGRDRRAAATHRGALGRRRRRGDPARRGRRRRRRVLRRDQ